ncbi:MAG: SDR family NAD(P)-dependent oxidoreductase, partial [Muribaculaceae bacterium]|nr:SDR family NAD(P)-dependent oxidoreductase [Muribaculaceae bacterium]
MTPVYTGYYLLTGATGAIGKEIARDLASKGEKLILAVRNMDKANELREELLRDYSQCQTIETL